MGREEQKEEREVLDSIFPEEITDVSDTEFRVAIVLDVLGDEDDAESDPPTILLHVIYPEEYPDVAPDLDINAPPNAPKHKYLDVQDDKTRLLESLQADIEEYLGTAMVFTLVSTLKESAELLIAERVKAKQALLEVEAAKAEEEENRKFHGTAVTRESFLEWRAKFQKELAEEEKRKLEEKEAEEKRKRIFDKDKKLTGKQLWEKGLAGKAGEDEDGIADFTEGAEKLKIDADA